MRLLSFDLKFIRSSLCLREKRQEDGKKDLCHQAVKEIPRLTIQLYSVTSLLSLRGSPQRILENPNPSAYLPLSREIDPLSVTNVGMSGLIGKAE